MVVKKIKGLPIKEVLFTFLAINKILYYFSYVNAMNQTDFWKAAEALFIRIIESDLLLIIGVIAFFFLDKQIESKKIKYNSIIINLITYAIGYVVLMSIAFLYSLILTIIYSVDFSFSVYFNDFIYFIPGVTLSYIVIAIVLEIKYYFKNKEKKKSAEAMLSESSEDKLTMLKILFEDGLLSQEEYDIKKDKLLCT